MARLGLVLIGVAMAGAGALATPASAGQRGGGAGPTAAQVRRVQEAIVTSVRERMGDGADVTVERLEITGDPLAEFLQAVPEPDARTGERMAFRVLGAEGGGEPARVVASATAIVRVALEHVRVRSLVTRGRDLSASDVERADGPVDGVPLRRLPRLSEVSGARTLVNLAPGEVVGPSAVTARPAVKSGQVVRAVARIDGLEVTAALVAAQDGAPGAVIRVVNKDSRRELRARVLEAGVVEVIP